jgi:hypothetical protein
LLYTILNAKIEKIYLVAPSTNIMIQGKALVVTTLSVAVVAVSVTGSTIMARPVYTPLLNDLLSQPMQLTPAEKQQSIKEVQVFQQLSPVQKQAAISHLKAEIQSLPDEQV